MKGDRGQRSQTQMSGQVGEDPGTGEVYWCPGEWGNGSGAGTLAVWAGE